MIVSPKRILTDAFRLQLRVIQTLSSRAANFYGKKPNLSSSHDLFKAKIISEHIEDSSKILDIGCGNGRRLLDISMFKNIEAHGIEIYDNSLPYYPINGKSNINIMKFDGKNIPFANKSNDVSMICYVLHHLEYNHAKFLINEAIRVSKSKLIILEDTMPVFNLFYKVRNWCHATEANLEYSVRSEDFMQNFNHNMFKTHKEWEDFFKEFDTVKKIDIISLKHISQYAHHTMLVITLKEKE